MTRLEQLRLDKGWTPEVLAEVAGVSSKTVRRLESGKVTGRVDSLVALASALDARPSELLQAAIPPQERAA